NGRTRTSLTTIPTCCPRSLPQACLEVVSATRRYTRQEQTQPPSQRGGLKARPQAQTYGQKPFTPSNNSRTASVKEDFTKMWSLQGCLESCCQFYSNSN